MNQHLDAFLSPAILIVEDDDATGEVLHLVIEQETPYHLQLAATGREALDAIQTFTPHLCILDYRLPDMTGLELYQRMQTLPEMRTVPTFFMSASKLAAKVLPTDLTLLSKPFELDDFLTVVDSLIKMPVPLA